MSIARISLRQRQERSEPRPYERNCKAHWVTLDDPMPGRFQLPALSDDLER